MGSAEKGEKYEMERCVLVLGVVSASGLVEILLLELV
jgi:hypothetical protein